MHDDRTQDTQTPDGIDEDQSSSVERRRAILRRMGQGSVVVAAAAVPMAASAGMLSRWNQDPSKRTGSAGRLKMGVAVS